MYNLAHILEEMYYLTTLGSCCLTHDTVLDTFYYAEYKNSQTQSDIGQ